MREKHLEKREDDSIAGFSLKTFLITVLGILLFGMYVGVLMYGKNSLTVLNHLKDKKLHLSQEEVNLKAQNQKLQKEFFELKQLEPKE
jgi:hypothetical protein